MNAECNGTHQHATNQKVLNFGEYCHLWNRSLLLWPSWFLQIISSSDGDKQKFAVKGTFGKRFFPTFSLLLTSTPTIPKPNQQWPRTHSISGTTAAGAAFLHPRYSSPDATKMRCRSRRPERLSKARSRPGAASARPPALSSCKYTRFIHLQHRTSFVFKSWTGREIVQNLGRDGGGLASNLQLASYRGGPPGRPDAAGRRVAAPSRAVQPIASVERVNNHRAIVERAERGKR